MTRKSIGYVHLRWTCPHCETENLGPNKFCNGCGAPQPEDVPFHQAPDEELITDADEIELAKAGPDIHCPYCGARNQAGVNFCGACGGDLSEGALRERGRVLGAHPSEHGSSVPCPSCGGLNSPGELECEHCGASLAKKIQVEQGSADRGAAPRMRWALPVILFCLAAAVMGIYLLTRTQEVIGRVESVRWSRTIPILALMSVEREGWLEEIPADATVGACSLTYHHTQDSPAPNAEESCGTPYTIDEGTGYGEVVQDCVYEVYEDWCTYSALDWTVIDEISVSGSDLNPYWPETTVSGDQKAGEGVEQYEVRFSAPEGDFTFSMDEMLEFTRFEFGSEWILEINTFDTVVSVAPAN